MNLNSEKPTVVSLFCGAGGMDYGFNKAGFKSILGIDIDEDSCMTYKQALNTEVLNSDILTLDMLDIPDSDLIISSIITPSFSLGGKKADFSGRDKLLSRVLEIIELKLPKAFVFECIKPLMSYDKGSTFDSTIKFLEKLGYRVSYQVLNTLHYSIPQTRKRLVIVGINNDLSEIRYEFPEPHKEKVTLNKVLKTADIDKNGLLPIEFVNLKKFERVLELDNVAPTLVHPSRFYIKCGELLKRVTSKEAAIIQSFPISFHFVGSEMSRNRQITNAFPPALAYYIAQELITYFDQVKKIFEPYNELVNLETSKDHINGDNINKIVKKDMKDQRVDFQIKEIQPGRIHAYKYENTIFENLKNIFDNQLKLGKQQVEINEGRKRIDIVFSNRVGGGFFGELKTLFDIKCAKIMIECKNYKGDLKNPDFDQLIGRFDERYSEFGILICRNIFDKEKAFRTCRDISHKRRGTVMVLDDEDIMALLSLRNEDDYEGINNYMLKILDKILD